MSSTIPNMPSITKRFASALYRGLWGTVQDRIFDILVIVGGALYWVTDAIRRGGWTWQSLTANGREGLTVGTWVVCAAVVWHTVRAASVVLAELKQQTFTTNSGLVSVDGSPLPSHVNGYTHLKLGTMALCIIAVAFVASYFVWAETKRYERRLDDVSNINDAEFLDIVNAWGVEPTPAGSTGGEGYEDINMTRLLPFKDKYDLMLVARVHDTHLSAFKDSNIQKSNLFPILETPPNTMRITIKLPSSFLASRMSNGNNGEMEFHLCLIPRTLDASTIVKLDDITARGGHVFRPARGGGVSIAATAPTAIPLAPSSPNAHSIISETFVGVIEDEPRHNMTVEIHVVATTDVQVRAVARMNFMFGRKLIETNAVSMDFVSRNQTQAVLAGVNFSPLDWSDFISGSVPLTVRIPVEYKDRGMRMQYLVTGQINSKSDQLANLKTEWIKLR